MPEPNVMPAPREYDPIAAMYDLWASGDSASAPCWAFYQSEVARRGGVCLEVGVGTGSVMLGVGHGPAHYYGVDLSPRMLAALEQKQRNRAPLPFPCSIVEGDILDVAPLAPQPSLAIVPFRTIGHFLTPAAKIALLRKLRTLCAPGAICLLDHYKFNPEWARAHDGVPRLMTDLRTPHESLTLMDTYVYDFARRTMDCLLTVQRRDAADALVEARKCRFAFSWLEDEEMFELAGAAGWRVLQRWGDFEGGKFGPAAENQVWELQAG